MGIGSSVFLIALGAILAFAVNAEVSYVSLQLVDWILMVAGAIGLIWSLLAMSRRRTVETRSAMDPRTGDRMERSDVRDGF